jgi:SAM-dependent methyltransferase
MVSEITGAQRYFDRVPKQWDAFYSHENRFMFLINNLLRKGLYERHRLTFEHCGDLSGKTVLDIGCGTGRYGIECIKKGAIRVVGIDFAQSMIDFSRRIAKQMKVDDKCEFICDDFLTHQFEGRFDIILALGFFDYIKDAELIFKKIAMLNPHRFIASFPRFTSIWSLQRAIRYYWIKKCPIYNYSKEQLEQLYRKAPFQDYLIIPCGKGFLGVAGTEYG